MRPVPKEEDFLVKLWTKDGYPHYLINGGFQNTDSELLERFCMGINTSLSGNLLSASIYEIKK